MAGVLNILQVIIPVLSYLVGVNVLRNLVSRGLSHLTLVLLVKAFRVSVKYFALLQLLEDGKRVVLGLSGLVVF